MGEIMKENKPSILIGYPSTLYHIAKYIEDNDIYLEIPYIITSSEILYDFQRYYIESRFNSEIFNRYGSREFGAIAQECDQHSGLHINSEHLVLDFLDQSNCFL